MKYPLISVVVPAYNYAAYIGETIDSILAQTYRNIEIIIIDDGSTDNTAQVVQAYGDQVRYVAKQNEGLSAARNTGTQHAQGEYIAYIDADDTLAPTFVEATLSALNAHPEAAFAYTQQRFFEAASGVTTFPPYNLEQLKQANNIPACILIRANVAKQHPYDPQFKAWEDWDHNLLLAEHGLHGVLVNEPLINYRKHHDTQSMLDTFQEKAKVRTLGRLRLKHWRLYGVAESLRFSLWYIRNR
jgi:glycosyltransferase involved in cell wall biosynthesis